MEQGKFERPGGHCAVGAVASPCYVKSRRLLIVLIGDLVPGIGIGVEGCGRGVVLQGCSAQMKANAAWEALKAFLVDYVLSLFFAKCCFEGLHDG
jgi:hypothetical protein